MQILTPNNNPNVVLYPACYEAWLQAASNPWLHTEVAMQSDLDDWRKASEQERQAIAGMLRGFVQIEQRVGCYWRDIIATNLPHPEIQGMAAAFSAAEFVHLNAYKYLEASLGLDMYEAFLADKATQAKLNQFEVPDYCYTAHELAKSIALFSAAGEGVSLFASFLVLLSYTQSGRFKGIKQLLSWSVRDEDMHAEQAAYLFKQLVAEGATKPAESWVADMLNAAKHKELAFIKQAMGNANKIAELTLAQIEAFIEHRCDLMAERLGYNSVFYTACPPELQWFYLTTSRSATTHSDFFALSRNGSAYNAKQSQDFKQGLLDAILQSA